jgi:hypothetical protein
MQATGQAPTVLGSEDRRPSKPFFRQPMDTRFLPKHLSKFLDILLGLRREEGDVSAIAPSYNLLAELYGCCRGHAIRLLDELAEAYPDISIEKPSATFRVIRFNFDLAGADGASEPSGGKGQSYTPSRARRDHASRARRAQQAELPLVDELASMVAPGAPKLVAPGATSILSKNLEFENTTLRNGLESTNANATDVEPATQAGPRETEDERQARLDAHLESLPIRERADIDSAARQANPAGARFPAFFRSACHKVLTDRYPDRYPPLVSTTPAPPPDRPATPASTAELIRRLADPCGPEAVREVVSRVIDELDDAHSADFHFGLFTAATGNKGDLDRLARMFTTSKTQTERPKGKHFGMSVSGARKMGGLKNHPPVNRGSIPAGGPKASVPTPHNYR